MIGLTFSKRVSDFVDAADVGGNIKNSKANLNYLRLIDMACVKSGITIGAVYPFIGGTAFSHKFNFLNPSQFQITWYGTLTHSIFGVKGNAIDGYGDFDFTSSNVIQGNSHISFYINGFISEPIDSIAGFGLATTTFMLGFYNNFAESRMYTQATQAIFQVNSNFNGHYLGSRVSNNSHFLIKNSMLLNEYTITNTSVLENGTAKFRVLRNLGNTYSAKRISFLSVGLGLSKSISSIFSHDIYTAQRSIGRA